MKKTVVILFLLIALFISNLQVEAQSVKCTPIKIFYLKNFEIKETIKDNCGFGMTEEIIQKQREKERKALTKYIIN